MKMILPENVNRIIHTLEEHGHDAYAVGGCVRDTLLGKEPKDWDITTSAKPEEVKALFSHTIDTGIQHGTVTVMMDHVGYEVTTFRIDGEYEDSRHPKEVQFTSNLLEDLRRRDFTINAMAYNDRDGLVDAFEGEADLKRGIIRCVGEPKERFTEDALRMLRAIRFAASLGFAIEENTSLAIKELAPTLSKISAERIQVELVKTVCSPHPEEMRVAYELGLTKVFFPEFDVMMETPQNNKHHMYSVGEHTIWAMIHAENERILRLSMLFHDIAKPATRTTDEEGQDHFYGHPEKGVDMARVVMRRLKFDNDTIALVTKMVREHDNRPELSERNVRRAMNRVGTEYMPLLFAVKRADTLAQSQYHRAEKMAYVDEYEALYHKIDAEGQCVTKAMMKLNGKDLIGAGMKPGKEMGELLDKLFEEVLNHPEWNDHDFLMQRAMDYWKR